MAEISDYMKEKKIQKFTQLVIYKRPQFEKDMMYTA